MNKNLIYVVLVFFITSCNSHKVATSNTEEAYKEVVKERLGEDVLYLLNKPKTYVLCIKEIKGTTLQPRNTVNYIVVKIDNNAVVLENKIEGGSVSWASKNEVEVFRIPGIVRKDQSRADFITLYNVETGKSYPKKKTEQQ